MREPLFIIPSCVPMNRSAACIMKSTRDWYEADAKKYLECETTASTELHGDIAVRLVFSALSLHSNCVFNWLHAQGLMGPMHAKVVVWLAKLSTYQFHDPLVILLRSLGSLDMERLENLLNSIMPLPYNISIDIR